VIRTVAWIALLLGAASAAEPPPAAKIGQVSWLAGCWEMKTAKGTVEEHWMAPRGGCMINTGRTVRADTLFEYEQVVLREKDGRLAYEAHPSGQPSATFLSSEVTDSTVVFENPQHDFPQRVGYRRAGADSLIGWIDSTLGGKARKVEFPMHRAACSGS